MEEQLKLIQSLKNDIKELNGLIKENRNNYKDKISEYNFTLSTIDNLKIDLERFKLYFRNDKDGKIIKVINSLLIIAMSSSFIFFKFFINLPLYNIIMCEMLIMMASLIPLGLSVTVFDSIIEKYLVKKYPNIKILYDRIASLNNAIVFKEQNLMNLKKDREELETTLEALEEQLERKREELDSVEEEYFSSLAGKSITTEDEKNIGSVGKGKLRVRIPDKKENLGN